MPEDGLLLQEEKAFQRYYRFSRWWIEHRALVRKMGYGFLIACDVLVLFFMSVVFFDAFVFGAREDRLMVEQLVVFGQRDLHAYTISRSARPLETDSLRVLALGNKRYDLYTNLTNVNDDWWAEFQYQFVFDDGTTDWQSGFILPSEHKPLVHFAISSETPLKNARVEFDKILWHRVDHHLIADYPLWVEERLQFVFSDVQFTQEVAANGTPIGRSSFTVQNQSAFGYYDPAFFLLLKRGNAVVGVNRIVLSSLESGEMKEVSVNWFDTLPSVSQVEVVVEIFLFDLATYKPLEGEASYDTRSRVFHR